MHVKSSRGVSAAVWNGAPDGAEMVACRANVEVRALLERATGFEASVVEAHS